MNGNQTIISKPGQPDKAFTFDESYWSCDKEDPDYADQEHVYNDLGRGLLDHAFDGYNCCIFACLYI
jgi:kinesin family protein 1